MYPKDIITAMFHICFKRHNLIIWWEFNEGERSVCPLVIICKNIWRKKARLNAEVMAHHRR